MQYNITLTEEEINSILVTLGKLPYETSFQLITNLQQQALKQQNEKPKKIK